MTPLWVLRLTAPDGLVATRTSISDESWVIRAPWAFSASVASEPMAVAWAMLALSWEIWERSWLAWVTSLEIWVSAWLPSRVSWAEMLWDWLRKLVTSLTAWVLFRLLAGSLAAAVKSEKTVLSEPK